MHPFLAHHGPKNSLRFSAHFCGLEKNRREQRTEKIASCNFCLPIFANKIISAAPKLSAKNGLRPSHESTCDLSANSADKKAEINDLQQTTEWARKEKEKASREERIACENALLAQKQAEGFKKEQEELKRKNRSFDDFER